MKNNYDLYLERKLLLDILTKAYNNDIDAVEEIIRKRLETICETVAFNIFMNYDETEKYGKEDYEL